MTVYLDHELVDLIFVFVRNDLHTMKPFGRSLQTSRLALRFRQPPTQRHGLPAFRFGGVAVGRNIRLCLETQDESARVAEIRFDPWLFLLRR